MSTEALHGAAVSLEEIVAQDPTTAFYLPLAEKLLARGSTAEAIRLCEERRLRPGRGVGDHIVLGRCYLADGRLIEARAEFRAALDLDRENVIALKSLAGILSHEGLHADAADLYRAVCRVDPGDLESQTALHQITSGDYAEVRPAEVIVGQGDLAWQPVRLTREEDYLPELALGLRTLETHAEGLLRPSTPEAAERAEQADADDFIRSEVVGPAASASAPAAAVSPFAHRPPVDPFEDRLGGIDVGEFQESALERLEVALRPMEARPLGEVEPASGGSPSRSAIWSEGGGDAPAAAPAVEPAAEIAAAPAVAPAAKPAAAASPAPRPKSALPAPEPPVSEPPAPGNRAAFETWLRNLGGGGRS
jgi:tetratricopeptide (TPR) repeat protein